MRRNLKKRAVIALIALLILLSLFYRVSIERDKELRSATKDNTVYLDSLTLRQKIAQMIVTYGEQQNREELQRMMVGGIYIGNASSKEETATLIDSFQQAAIPFLVAADMEGCWNPFEAFYSSKPLTRINTEEEALNFGIEHGKILKETGININFAPVADLQDRIWKCRSFTGTPQDVAEKAEAYIKGLQSQGVMATAKHYPGKTLSVKDPHLQITAATIDENDLLPFKRAIAANVSAIMVSHLIVNGSVNSEGKPASTSQKLISELRSGFSGLIITDEIGMDGLENYYEEDRQRFIEVFNSGADIIIYFDRDSRNTDKLIGEIEEAVMKGEINESKIDAAATRILKAKGLNVK